MTPPFVSSDEHRLQKKSQGARTSFLICDEADAFDWPILLKLAPELLLCGVIADARDKQRLEWVALQTAALFFLFGCSEV